MKPSCKEGKQLLPKNFLTEHSILPPLPKRNLKANNSNHCKMQIMVGISGGGGGGNVCFPGVLETTMPNAAMTMPLPKTSEDEK